MYVFSASSEKALSSRGWRSAPRDPSTANYITQIKVEGRSGVDAPPLRKPLTASALGHASTPDRRSLIPWVIQLAGVVSALLPGRDPGLRGLGMTRVSWFAKTKTLNRYSDIAIAFNHQVIST